MKIATRLQLSTLMKAIARATGWAMVTMTVGLILVILFGSPLAASSPSSNDLPGSSYKNKTGPWGSRPVAVRV
jgi:Na+/glutamate symporter